MRGARQSWLRALSCALVIIAAAMQLRAAEPSTGTAAKAELARTAESSRSLEASTLNRPQSQGLSLAVFAKTAPESVDDLVEIERHLEKLAEKVIPCTVAVQIEGVQGSGVIISKDGYVLTAGHVSGKPDRNVKIILHDGRTLTGKTLGRNIGIDSGLIKITSEGKWPFAETGESKDLKPGQWCMATGHPGGYQRGREPVVRFGRVVDSRDSVIRTDCTLVGGDSGGPLFDMQGRVIGIHSRISTRLTENYHVPVQTYLETWARLDAREEWGGRLSGGIIGIRGEDVKEGCRITELFPGLPAEKAGLKVGDVVTKVDGDRVGSLGDLVKLLGKRKPGDEVTLEYLRDGQPHSQRMKLASPTASP